MPAVRRVVRDVVVDEQEPNACRPRARRFDVRERHRELAVGHRGRRGDRQDLQQAVVEHPGGLAIQAVAGDQELAADGRADRVSGRRVVVGVDEDQRARKRVGRRAVEVEGVLGRVAEVQVAQVVGGANLQPVRPGRVGDVGGGLWEGDKLRRVDVRYRGDNVYHWGYFKKSWRVKTKKGTLYDGMRRFNLIAPITAEIVNNHRCAASSEA